MKSIKISKLIEELEKKRDKAGRQSKTVSYYFGAAFMVNELARQGIIGKGQAKCIDSAITKKILQIPVVEEGSVWDGQEAR